MKELSLKSRVLPFLLAVTLISLITPTPSSEAIFGLSKCEKIKKEIIYLETYLKKQISLWDKYSMNELNKTQEKKFKQFVLRGNIDLRSIFKLSYNNPKCFTNTQNLRIAETQKETISNYISFISNNTSVNTSIQGCPSKDPADYFKCLKVSYFIGETRQYKSIYE